MQQFLINCDYKFGCFPYRCKNLVSMSGTVSLDVSHKLLIRVPAVHSWTTGRNKTTYDLQTEPCHSLHTSGTPTNQYSAIWKNTDSFTTTVKTNSVIFDASRKPPQSIQKLENNLSRTACTISGNNQQHCLSIYRQQ